MAAHEALASACHATATVLGGFAFDWLSGLPSAKPATGSLNPFMVMFVLGLSARLLAVPLAAAIVEPAAWRWIDLIRWKSMQSSQTEELRLGELPAE